MFKWVRDWQERRRRRREDEAMDRRIDDLLARARAAPPMTERQQAEQRASFVYGNLALDGSEVTRKQVDEASGLPYIVIKQ